MLPKKNRVNKKNIDLIFKQGRIINSTLFSFRFIKGNNTQISFIAPKNIAKLAVHRNSLRRKGYNLLKKHINTLPVNIIGVFVFKKKETDNLVIDNEIQNIFNKVN